MSWQPAQARSIADLERLLSHVEERLARLSRNADHAAPAASRAADRVSGAIAATLTDIAERFRGGPQAASAQVSHLGRDALKVGNDALRTLTKDVEQRPLVTLAVAFGIGMIAAGLLLRKT